MEEGGKRKRRREEHFCPRQAPPQPFLWDEDVQRVGKLDDRIQMGEQGLANRLHQAIMNLAMDKSLAASIFNNVVSGRNPTSQGLECLEICVNALNKYSGFFCPSDIVRQLQFIGRSWTCTRDSSHDGDHHCHVTEYDPENIIRRKTTESFRLQTNLWRCMFWNQCGRYGQKVVGRAGKKCGTASILTKDGELGRLRQLPDRDESENCTISIDLPSVY